MYVEPLPRPEKMNSEMNPATNSGSELRFDARIVTLVPAASARNVHRVTFAPPIRSDSHPPTGLISDPTSGPRKVIEAACSGVRPNWLCNTRPKAKL